MEHIFIEGEKNKPVLILFHGTGGNESSLVGLGKEISSSSSILGIRGNVKENGMNRYFKRLGEGVFDEEDLILRTHEIYNFLIYASDKYSFDLESSIAIGYSNGANIIGSLLYIKGKIFSGVALHHPMVPFRDRKPEDLRGIDVFIGAGRNDNITPMSEAINLEKDLINSHAKVTMNWEDNGHQLTISEVKAVKKWFKDKIL